MNFRVKGWTSDLQRFRGDQVGSQLESPGLGKMTRIPKPESLGNIWGRFRPLAKKPTIWGNSPTKKKWRRMMLRQVFCTTAIRNLLKVVGSSTCLLSDCESSESSCGSCSKKAWQEEGLPSFFLHQTIFNIRISKSSRMKFNVPSRTRRSSRPWWSTQTRSSCT